MLLAELAQDATTSSTAEMFGIIVMAIIFAIGIWLGVIFWQERK